jgi:carboxymethylenebutenolidase
LLCLCGTEDDLIPPADVAAITVALGAINPIRQEAGLSPHQLLSLPGGHGFLCEERGAFHPESAAIAWDEILSLFAETLG